MTRYVAALLVVLLVGVVGVLAIGAGYAKNENASRAKCSEATLDGTYLFAEDGVLLTDNDQVPFALAGYQVYNGNGKVKGVQSGNFGEEIVRNERFSGTYTVRADCTGTLTFEDDTRFDLFIAPDGSKFMFVQTKPSELVAARDNQQVTAKRVGD